MAPIKRLVKPVAKHLLTFWKGRKAQRARRKATRSPQQKAQLIATYLLGAVIVGWFLLPAHPMLSTTHIPPAQTLPAVQTELPGARDGGRGAGGQATNPSTPATANLCNPFDPSCIANAIASWAASALMGAFSPLTGGILKDPADIIFQTPPTDSYRNSVIMTINGAFVGVLDAALACLLLIGAYNVLWGHHLRMAHSSVTELIPRAVLVVGAVHFNLVFLGMFVDLANELSLTVIHLATYHTLIDVIAGLLTNSGLAGLLILVLVVVLGILVVFLVIQRVGTIALIALLLSIAPLGLACFLLPQTMRWGRLWLSMLSSALVTQVLQVTTLGLGGMFLTSLGTTSLFHLDQGLANTFLAIGTMLLVLKIPGMLQTWALNPAWDNASASSERSGSTDSSEEHGSAIASSSGSSAGSATTTSASGTTGLGAGAGSSGSTTAAASGGGGGDAATVALLA